MQIVIDIPNAPINDYQDLYYKIHGMAASEGLFDDKEKSQRALALKVVLDMLEGVVNGTPLPKGHGRLKDVDHYIKMQWEHPDYSLTDDAPTIIEADKEQEDGNDD